MASGIWTATAADYVRALQGLLPRGLIWTRVAARRLTRLLGGLADELARVHNRASALMDEADPQTTTELLPDWERTVGLPEPGDVLAATPADRRAGVVAKLRAQGGAAAEYFEAVAAKLGVTAVVTEPLAWLHVWQVAAPAVVDRMACNDPCNSAVVSFGDLGLRLRALFTRIKPGHTRIYWTDE